MYILGISAYYSDKLRLTSTSKQTVDAFWAPAWRDSQPNRTWGYLFWAFYTHSNAYASQWTR